MCLSHSDSTTDIHSGNNWASGFFVHGHECEVDIMNLVRKNVEKFDSLGGMLILQSVAGGTGRRVVLCDYDIM